MMIYLDHAATSFPKPECVYKEMDRCMRDYCANPGRGGHTLSIKAGMAVLDARERICSIFHINDPLRLGFTKNATEALNVAIHGLSKQECHIITTGMEHNSVMRPLRTLEKHSGVNLTILQGNTMGEVDPDDFKRSIRPKTSLIICTLSSNVNGIIMPVEDIGRIASEAGIPFLVDASQGAGSIHIDVEKQWIDLLAFPGHKGLMGPQGTGGLYVREGVKLQPLMEGGTGSNSEYPYQPEFMPDLLESGTLNTPGIIGLGCGADYVKARGVGEIGEYKYRLVKMLMDALVEIPGITCYSPSEKHRNSGIAAINLDGMDSIEFSYILDHEYGILTRAGLHCAPGAHRILGTEKQGVVRFSTGCMTDSGDIQYTIDAVEKIAASHRS